MTTPKVDANSATIDIATKITTSEEIGKFHSILALETFIYDANGKEVGRVLSNQGEKKGTDINLRSDSPARLNQKIVINEPHLWSVDNPYLYKVEIKVYALGLDGDKTLSDVYTTPCGIRYFNFDPDKGFSLNGKYMKILGVCDHHDLGSLGAAVNTRALERQLQLLRSFGCNAIRTSHNPPAPELLDLCDKMGFIVMDEAFDCWEKGKVDYDYHLYFKDWHKRDLEDQVLRDRNHPSVIIWSIGNEIPQQSDTSALRIAPELAAIVHNLDTTRPSPQQTTAPIPAIRSSSQALSISSVIIIMNIITQLS